MQQPAPDHKHLAKFLLGSATGFFIGTVQGVVQLLPPVRAWLDSVGSPISGPGHMIDPLAHVHINVVGGVVLMTMAVTYYLFPIVTGYPVWSRRLVHHSFWWTFIGVCGFYTTLLIFGIIEGNLLLTDPSAIPAVHRYYAPVLSAVATVMGIGFWVFFINVFMGAKSYLFRS
ncbi:MAG TPA: cytochrome oxidase [Devosia sp.]|nr:cytochrome oxidase [Devosia sp.]